MALVRVAWKDDNRAGFLRDLGRQVEDALGEVGDDCLEKSNRVIPLQDGILQDSGFFEVNRTPNGAEGQVAYSTPYAVKQHEDPTLQHDEGRQDHYLEDTVNQNSGEWEELVARSVGNGLR